MRYLLIVAMIAGPARADDARKAADQLLAEATRTHDEAKAVACGNAYLDLYNHDAAAPGNDEIVFDAATCFEIGKSVGTAITTYQLLIRYFPHSKLSAKARWQSANLLMRIARFDDAAARFEEYAKLYAGEKDARDAIENAIVLRAAIGDSVKRIEDTKYFVRTFGMKAPKEAAAATLAVLSAYDAPDDQIAVLRDYLRAYGGKAEREQLVLAHVQLGDALWRRACPTTPIDGLCMKVIRDTATPRCAATDIRIEIVARSAAFRKAALAEYDAAIKLVEQAGLKDAASVHLAAMARIARADDDLERMLDKPFPTGLDFDPAHKAAKDHSLERFNDWVDARKKAGEALNQAYEAVLQLKDEPAAIAATARIGQIAESFSRAFVTGEIPSDVRAGDFAKDKTAAYCDKMKEVSEPLAARAAQAFTTCVDKAAKLGVLDGWVAICRAGGQLVDPKHFPPQEVQPELTIEIPTAIERPAKTAQLAQFAANEQAGWTDKTCRQTAAAFAASKPATADALYMAGLSFERCGITDDARRAYDDALKLAPDHAATLSNLGELAWRAGQRDAAMKSWAARAQARRQAVRSARRPRDREVRAAARAAIRRPQAPAARGGCGAARVERAGGGRRSASARRARDDRDRRGRQAQVRPRARVPRSGSADRRQAPGGTRRARRGRRPARRLDGRLRRRRTCGRDRASLRGGAARGRAPRRACRPVRSRGTAPRHAQGAALRRGRRSRDRRARCGQLEIGRVAVSQGDPGRPGARGSALRSRSALRAARAAARAAACDRGVPARRDGQVPRRERADQGARAIAVSGGPIASGSQPDERVEARAIAAPAIQVDRTGDAVDVSLVRVLPDRPVGPRRRDPRTRVVGVLRVPQRRAREVHPDVVAPEEEPGVHDGWSSGRCNDTTDPRPHGTTDVGRRHVVGGFDVDHER
jgi:tetratricopeptide (TPR) repeat protein